MRPRSGRSSLCVALTLLSAVVSFGAVQTPALASHSCTAPINSPALSGNWYMNATHTAASSSSYTCLVQRSVVMVGGSSYLFFGSVDALKTGTTLNMLQAIQLKCGSDAGVVTTQNNLGSRLRTYIHSMFTAPTTGTYTCTLSARGETTNGSGSLTIYGGTSNGTYMTINTSPKAGRQWKSAAPVLVPKGGSVWYMNSGNYGITTQSSIQLFAGVEITNCYSSTYTTSGVTFSCGGGNANATATVQLAALVTNTAGDECTSVPRQYFTPITVTILHDSHHQKVHAPSTTGASTVTIPGGRPSGCNFFKFKALVTAGTTGNPLVIEASSYSNGVAYNA